MDKQTAKEVELTVLFYLAQTSFEMNDGEGFWLRYEHTEDYLRTTRTIYIDWPDSFYYHEFWREDGMVLVPL